ncbi:MAG TPA: Rrf2 family transcriptional regulator [Bacteroidia bacterium]|nr:Rrf2 family transcriptional regulator [Bacteroidia bacterium]
MELSRFTDYSLRTLIFAGLHADRIVTIGEVSATYRISENHLVKIIHKLGKLGFVDTKRGRSGGFQLSREPSAINLGEVVRATESLSLVECLGADGGHCPIVRVCQLRSVIVEAREAFLEVFDRRTLEDMLEPRKALFAVSGGARKGEKSV